jgi:DNA repair exonuclease SbcCD ATPase subunit
MTTNELSVAASNIGGIDETTLSFEPGVTVLAGRNATNRTSFLQAVMAAFGSENASLKADADEGVVELELDGEQYTRTLTRTSGGVAFGGDPYLDDSTVADLFAFLLETNEARLAVSRGDDLRELIMRPIDTASIQSEIERLEAEKRDIDKEIAEVESLSNSVSTLQRRLTEREQEIAETEAELEEKESELEALDRDLEETRQEQSDIEDTFDDLRAARRDLEQYQYNLETEQESLASLEGEREDVEAELADLETVSESRLSELTHELQQRRDEKQALESEISTVQRVISFNEEMLEGTSADITSALRMDGGSQSAASVTDQLLDGGEVVCWTCGSPVERENIEATIDRLQSLLREKHSELGEVESEIKELKSTKRSVESKQETLETLSARRRQVESEIDERTQEIADLRERIEAQSEELERLEAEAESMENESYDEILDTHKEANQLEFELDRLRTEKSELESELAAANDRLDDLDALEAERESVAAELQDLRTRIDRLEADAVEAFNEHMAEMLAVLEYENIERIWLERTEQQVREGRRKVTQSVFDLHIVRTASDGATYEDTVDHLSESEREVTGLIFALAGYLVHEVYEVLPVMLLDSLEAIDSDRIAALVTYFEQYADYLLVALLPEDAGALENERELVDAI